MSVTIQGADEVQAALAKAAAVAGQSGPLQGTVGAVAQQARTYAAAYSHVDTGALQASHTIVQSGARAEIYPSSRVINPRSGKSPAEYGIYEHDRGGSHAFYERTLDRFPQLAQIAEAYLRRHLP